MKKKGAELSLLGDPGPVIGILQEFGVAHPVLALHCMLCFCFGTSADEVCQTMERAHTHANEAHWASWHVDRNAMAVSDS